MSNESESSQSHASSSDSPPESQAAADQPTERTIHVAAMARVEGEGGITIVVRDGKVADAQLRIFEPPRFFESFLRGRSLLEVPDITARICGICPVAYQMSSCHAIEKLLGMNIPAPIKKLRRLLYCGEWIESHVLHFAFLHAPDFFGFESAIAMAQAKPEFAAIVRSALAVKKGGNSIVEIVGGREVHPINVRVGGFYKLPSRTDLAALADRLERVLDVARELVRWTAKLDFPDYEYDYEYVSLTHPVEYPMNEGRLVSSKGLNIDMSEYPDHFEERQVPYSNALQCLKKGGGAYFTGPLARWNLNRDRATVDARVLGDELGISWPCNNPFVSIVARAIEVFHAVDLAIRLIREYEPAERAFEPVEFRAGTGAWITEAPRGILYHRYEADAHGAVVAATIVPPTSQNQRQIEEDLIRFAPSILDIPQADAEWKCEQVVRNYDPCISCATHFLTLNIQIN